MKDKYSAIWVSHSSISDFLRCQRLYFLRNRYKDPRTGNKITITKPPLSLGKAVHDVVESLSVLPVEERFKISLAKKFDVAWQDVTGKRGGFVSKEQEGEFKQRGVEMLSRIEKNPGPLKNKAVKIPEELPFYWLSEKDNIILCGKIDWLEYKPGDDSVHIIDFKTGKIEEAEDSLQLPIYHLLATNTQKRAVSAISYWYLHKDNKPRSMSLPDLKDAHEKVIAVAKRISLARKLEHLKCEHGGCRWCLPLEDVVAGKGEKVGVSNYRQDIYFLAD